LIISDVITSELIASDRALGLMQQSKYITPRLGRRSVAIVTLGCMTVFFLIAQYRNAEPSWVEPQQRLARAMLLLGLCYGVASGLCWLATAIENPFARYVVRVILLIAVAFASNQVGTENWLRNLSNIGGFLIGQSLIFFTLPVPDWEPRVVRPGRSSASVGLRRQFGIGDVVIATTSIALLLAIIIRYLTPIESVRYWLVMTLVWGIGPSIAACLGLAALSRNAKAGVGLSLLGLMLAVGGTVGLALAESKLAVAESKIAGAASSISFGVSMYGLIMLGYFIAVTVIAIAGRIEPAAEPATGSVDQTDPPRIST
jgi:hypothetical protein